MSSDQSFLEVIQANPNEEMPKLIYADWLDEQGDPRGELIRLLMDVQMERESHKHWQDFLYSVEESFRTIDFAKLIQELDVRQQQLFACECAESVLYLFESIHPENRSPRRIIDVARAFLNDRTTEGKMLESHGEGRYLWHIFLQRDEDSIARCVIAAVNFAVAIPYSNRFVKELATSTDPEFAPTYKCARASALACGVEEPAAWNQQFLWLVERLLGFKID